MAVYTGFVKKINTKNGTGKGGKAWTAYSFRVAGEDGQEIDKWFSGGFKRPETSDGTPVAEGDFIRFEAKDDQYNSVDPSSYKRSKNPPANGGGAGSSAAGAPVSSGGGPNTQTSIHYQNSRTAAIALVDALLTHDSLPVTAGKNKGDKAKRYEQVLGFVDKITVQFFNDLQVAGESNPFRILDSVADGRIDGHVESELPDDVDEVQETYEPSPVENGGDGFE